MENRTALPPENHTPLLLENHTPPPKKEPESKQNQEAALARKLLKNNLKTIKNKRKTRADKKSVDARMVPARDFFFDSFQKLRGYRYRATGADFNALKQLIKDTAFQDEYSLEALQKAILRFLKSPDPFHQKQGKPLAYFCGNINAFMQGRTERDTVGKGDEKRNDPEFRRKYAEMVRAKPVEKRNAEEREFLAWYDQSGGAA